MGTVRNVFIGSAVTFSTRSTDSQNVGLFLQLAVAVIGLFTLLAVVIIGVIICRRSSTTVGMCTVQVML